MALFKDKEETLSEQSLKTLDNNPEENLLQYVGEQKLRLSVCVHTIGVMEKPYASNF